MARWLIVVGLALGGCPTTETDTGPDTDPDSDSDTDTDTECKRDPGDNVVGVVMKGTVVDVDGNPRTSGMQLCNSVGCRFATPCPDGTYVFQGGFEPGPFLYYTASAGLETATNYTITIPDVVEMDNNIVVHDVSAWADIGEASSPAAMGDGLTLTIGTDRVQLFDTRDLRLGGARVDLGKVPPLDIGTPVAAWYLRPFEAEIRAGQTVPFEIVADWTGAEESTSWQVYVGWYEWESAGVFQVTGGKLVGELPSEAHISSIWVVPAPR
jgi:hypothetical protein